MEKLLEEMHRRLPNTHIIVMAILPKVVPAAPLPHLSCEAHSSSCRDQWRSPRHRLGVRLRIHVSGLGSRTHNAHGRVHVTGQPCDALGRLMLPFWWSDKHGARNAGGGVAEQVL